MSVIPRSASASIRRGSRAQRLVALVPLVGREVGLDALAASSQLTSRSSRRATRRRGRPRRRRGSSTRRSPRARRLGRPSPAPELDRREAPALADAVVAPQDRGRLAELVGGEGVERVRSRQSEASRIPSPRASSSSVIVSGGSSRITLPCRPQASSSRPSARAAAIAPPTTLGRRRLGLAVADDLEREHRPEPAHLADRRRRASPCPPARRAAARRAPRTAARMAGDRVEHDVGRRAGDRVAAERAAEPARVDRVHDLRRAGHAPPAAARRRATCRTRAGRAARRSARSPTPGRCGRRRTGPRRRSTGSRGGRTARAGCAGKSAGIAMKPPSPWTGSRITAATVAGSTWARNSCSSAAMLSSERDPAVRVRRGRAVDLGRERPEALLVGLDLAGQRHRHQRAAVEAAVEA